MTTFTSHAPGEVIDAIRPDLEAFTVLWTALRLNYEGTNITRTVARLLHMYQPEEGVVAYERLLRTLFVLLEDFDSDGLQLLVSMVPPPKGASDELIKEVFNRATGFVRVDAPIFHKITDYAVCTNASSSKLNSPRTENVSKSTVTQRTEAIFLPQKLCSSETKKNSKPKLQINKTGVKNRTNKSPQMIQPKSSSEVFRGFPPSEIYHTQSHVQSIKNFYRPPGTFIFPQSGVAGNGGGGGGGGGQSFVNFGQIVGQNSGQIQQPVAVITEGLVAPTYRAKWIQSPYPIMPKNSYPVNQYQDVYLKTVDNQYVKVPAAKVNSFNQGDVNASRTPYQNLYTNAHDYLRNRSNTVTSGLLEKIQRNRGIQEAVIKKLLTVNEASPKNCEIIDTTQGNVELKIVDQGANEACENLADNLAAKTCVTSDVVTSEVPKAAENNEFVELDSNGKNSTLNEKTFEDFAKEVRMRQRAIQEDIYKMDVVKSEECDEDFVPGIEEKPDSPINQEMLTASEGLVTSCKKFVDRATTAEIVEVPHFPQTRSLCEIGEKSQVSQPTESNLWRLLTSGNVSEMKTATTPQNVAELNVESKSPSIEEPKVSLEPSTSLPKRVIRRKKSEVSTTRLKNQKIIPKTTVINHVINIRDDLDLVEYETRPKQDVIVEQNSQSVAAPASRCSSSSIPQTSSPAITSTFTMAELAAYKKQYYNTLLSIRKEKAAVANSLALSSVGSTRASGFDPYYYSYLQHQHRQILQRHQHQLIMGHHRFPQQRSMPTVTNPWFRSTEWRYPVIGQTRLPQRPQMLHPSSTMWPPGVSFIGRNTQIPVVHNQRDEQPTVSQVSKTPMRRRKLEEIVGKLKKSDNGGTNVSNENEVQINN